MQKSSVHIFVSSSELRDFTNSILLDSYISIVKLFSESWSNIFQILKYLFFIIFSYIEIFYSLILLITLTITLKFQFYRKIQSNFTYYHTNLFYLRFWLLIFLNLELSNILMIFSLLHYYRTYDRHSLNIIVRSDVISVHILDFLIDKNFIIGIISFDENIIFSLWYVFIKIYIRKISNIHNQDRNFSHARQEKESYLKFVYCNDFSRISIKRTIL